MVVRGGHRHVGAGMVRGDVAEQAEGPCLIAAFTAPASEFHGTVGEARASSTWSASRYASPSCSTLSEWYTPIPSDS